MIPVEISIDTPRIEVFDPEGSELGLRLNKDLLEDV